MKEKDQQYIFDQASQILSASDFYVKEFFDTETLAYWFQSVYNLFDRRKVITQRIEGENSMSIIVSGKRVAAINNTTGQSSWVRIDEVVRYEDIEDDILTLFTYLDFAIERTETH